MSKHFKPSETQCRCGCKRDISPAFLQKLDDFRDAMGFSLVMTSGARCEKWNQEKGGAQNSRHPRCCAADLGWTHLTGLQKRKMLDYASAMFPGIGLHEDFLHVDDDRPDGAMCWFYPRSEKSQK